eukprot:TRINITY_DN13280_c0_g1_i1.p1 TRINITY_DN13280_c0_g1~~TRINITY_DN13280_c0_g1_i1.p1  ORF type:complete len:206 (+),score=67.40 TRINITY_DN13280_c0_g1_i1:189-806(+)
MSESPQEDEDDDQNVEAKVMQLGKAQAVLATVQIMMSCAVLYLSAATKKDNERVKVTDIFSGTVGTASGVVGLIAGITKHEMLTRLYFIFQLWVLSTVTLFLFVTVNKEETAEAVCSPHQSFSQSSNSADCASGVAQNRAKLSFAVMGMLLALATCVVSFDFEDALDDYDDQLKAEKLVGDMDMFDMDDPDPDPDPDPAPQDAEK